MNTFIVKVYYYGLGNKALPFYFDNKKQAQKMCDELRNLSDVRAVELIAQRIEWVAPTLIFI